MALNMVRWEGGLEDCQNVLCLLFQLYPHLFTRQRGLEPSVGSELVVSYTSQPSIACLFLVGLLSPQRPS